MRQIACRIILSMLLVIPGIAAAKSQTALEFIDKISPPNLMHGVGNSQLKISTRNEKAQRFFNQGVSLLHDFWWFEAYRSFLFAAQLDPDAAMPHWGLYLAASEMPNLNKKQTKQVLDDAVKVIKRLRDNASKREQYYLDSVVELHADKKGRGQATHNAKLTALITEFPDEIEARLFLWSGLDVGYTADGSPKSEQLYGQLLLEQALEHHGDHHGVLHYWIHSQESGRHPESALNAAKKLADLAPNAGHIVHMPGHIHYLMGNYDEAHKQFGKAQKVDERYLSTYRIEPVFTWNYLHNFSFMLSNLAEAGRYAEGAEYVAKTKQLTRNSGYRDLPGFVMLLWLPLMEQSFMAIRLGQFDAAKDLLSDSSWDSWEKSEGLQATIAAYRTYAGGMAAAQSKEPDKAEVYSQQLDSILWRAKRDEINFSANAIALDAAALELQGMVASVRGDNKAAVKLLVKATEREADITYGEPRSNIHPAAESLALVHLADKDWKAARAAYNSVLKQRPNAGLPLFGIAQSYELEGKIDEASKAYTAFLAAWQSADEDLPQKQHAKAWLTEHSV